MENKYDKLRKELVILDGKNDKIKLIIYHKSLDNTFLFLKIQ